MRILFVGDVVGKVGREAIRTYLPGCISQWRIDLCVVNGENAADQGFGITQPIYEELLAAGADAVTLGNHSWNRREALQFIEDAPRLIRPINYLSGTPGRGAALIETKTGRRALVINALGRLFMEPVEDPFGRIGAEFDANPPGRGADAIIVDFHCEATGEKHAAGHFCDGRASLAISTRSSAWRKRSRCGGLPPASQDGSNRLQAKQRCAASLWRPTTGRDLPSGSRPCG